MLRVLVFKMLLANYTAPTGFDIKQFLRVPSKGGGAPFFLVS
jgi:hypothetical protein